MMRDLEYKANNEKYFKSIRYFSHSLKAEKRKAFISDVAKYNIYLAAQCIMSAEKDEELENNLIQIAIGLANNFNDSENSAKGFLALAEFENFNEIANLLKDVKKPSKVHSQVFSKILEGKNSELFITFLDVLTKINNVSFIHFAINSYSGILNVEASNKETLRNTFKILFDNGNYGMSRLALEKFSLYDNLSILLDNDIEKIVSSLLKSTKKVVQATRLAYEICSYYELLEYFNPELFINIYLRYNKGKSNKGLINSIDIAVKHNVLNNYEINKKLDSLISLSDKKSRYKINQLIKKGLYSYLNHNQELLKKVKDFIEVPLIYNKLNENIKNEYQITNTSIEACINDIIYADDKNDFVDEKLVALQEKWNVSLMEISHLLRIYELKGIVKHLLDYGCYVQSLSFKTEKLLFLHKNQITEKKEINHPRDVLQEGEFISYRIIGINQQNHRLNISCLESFKVQND